VLLSWADVLFGSDVSIVGPQMNILLGYVWDDDDF
jgi:hypothetical protein